MRKYLKDKVSKLFLCVDIETTGLDQNKDEIIELYYAVFDYESYLQDMKNELQYKLVNHKYLDKHFNSRKNEYIISEYNFLFYSDDVEKTKWLHGLSKRKLRSLSSSSLIDYLEFNKFLEYLTKCGEKNSDITLMSFYSLFEKKFLSKHLNMNEIQEYDVFDPWYLEKKMYPTLAHNAAYCALRRDITSDLDNQHRAKEDTLKMIKIALCQIAEKELLFDSQYNLKDLDNIYKKNLYEKLSKSHEEEKNRNKLRADPTRHDRGAAGA